MSNEISYSNYRRAVMRSGLDPRAKLVLLAIAEFYDDGGDANLVGVSYGHKSIALYLDVSVDHVQKWLKVAENAGWIKTENAVSFTLKIPHASP